MKRLHRILTVVLALLLLAVLAGILFIQHLKPDYEGEQSLPGLRDAVDVYYDPYGIPHIYAASETDGFRALGYAHAQDRLWQMDLLRRVAPGRLSEVFGPQTLETDKFFLTLGISDATRALLRTADTTGVEYQLALAYLEGVNAFIDEGPAPVEYYLTGLEKEHFSLEDVYNSIGYMAFSFAMAHKTDPFLEDLKNRLGPEYLSTLLEDCADCTEVIRTHAPADSLMPSGTISNAVNQLMDALPLPLMEGSNSWVLSPSKTRSGAVILANDPHIGFAQPSVWYEAHISGPGYERYGYHLAGIPFPLLAHNRNNAYGLTMFENDDINFFREEVRPGDPGMYRRGDRWKAFETLRRRIAVKGADSVDFSYRRTDLGPMVNDALPAVETEEPVSMSWVYTEGPNEVLQALFGISHAADLPSFARAVAKIHAPGLNVMYGDAQGHIAWWAAARLHRYPDSVSTKVFLEGKMAGTDGKKPLPFHQNPRAINPPWGYVYSANNQPDSMAGAGFVPGYYLPENRARRITALLEASDTWDREGVMEMILDVTSPVNTEVVTALASSVAVDSLSEGELECLDRINSWDGSYTLSNREALLYHRWMYFLFREVFGDELGSDGLKALMNTHLFKRLIARLVNHPEWIWWDNIQTEGHTETHSELVNRSFTQALGSLQRDFGPDANQWTWEKAHTLEFEHPMGEVRALRSFFNVGPFPVHGSREVINNMSFPYDSTGYYRVSAGPSTRRVIDFSDIENSMSILPTGQSGNPFSPHYDDQAEMYIDGAFRKMMMNKEEIIEKASGHLKFLPAGPANE